MVVTENPNSSLAQRLSFYQLDPNDSDFANIAKMMESLAEGALDKFYGKIAATPETARFFSGKPAMDRAHAAQAKHWQRIFSTGLTEAYFNASKTVGDVHSRIGLEPRWYIGGYANVLEQVITGILTRGFAGMSRRRKADARMVSVLVKVALLDMDIAITRYFEAEQERRVEVINAIGRSLGDLARGDLTTTLPKLPKDYAQIEQDFREALAHLCETFGNILEGSGQIASSATEIRTASDDLARRSEQQAASLEESAAAMDELTGAIAMTNAAMGDLNQSVSRTHNSAKGGGEVVRQAITAMDEIEKGSGEIAKIISIIDDIAFQTNLLALNAGVEAARVGEHGRGFAVVANEVRSLAQSSAQAAEQIKGLIKNSVSQVSNGVRMVNEVGKALTAIMAQVAETSEVAVKITESSATQSVNLKQINAAIAEMSETTQRNAAMVEQSNAAAHSMEAEATRVADAVGQFQVREKRKVWAAA
ncbi:globin-coupled sensor protein [bacterium]|nr:globin-coupled sensor protein [bacterium]